MAHILKIIPKGFRANKRVQFLSCMKSNAENIQQRIDCAAKAKQKLDADVFERNNKLNDINTKR